MGKFIFKYLESEFLTPCTPLLKSEGVPLIGDLIGAGASVYNTSETNKANAESVQKTNETNYQIAKETNDMSEKQFQTNLKWLQQQYYENQDREDTRYQRMVKDMQASGLNPALQNGQPSNVSSVGAPSPSSFHAAQMEAAHYDPLNLDFDPLAEHAANAITSYYQNRKAKAETENIGADTQTKVIENWTKLQRDTATFFETLAKIDNLISSSDVSKEQKEYLKQQRDNLKQNWELVNRQFEDLANQPKYQNSLLQSQESETQSRIVLNKIEAQFRPALLSAGIKVSQSQMAALEGAAALSWENAKTLYHERNDMLPKRLSQQDLINNYLKLRYGDAVEYDKFIHDKHYENERSALKLLSEMTGNFHLFDIMGNNK